MERQDELRGHTLVDAEDRTVGRITTYWVDRDRRPAYVLVKDVGLRAAHHVVPLHHAHLAARRVRVPYSIEHILAAPPHAPDEPLDPDFEALLLAHYLAAPAHVTPRAEPITQLPLHAERPHVEKRIIEAGGVRLRKIVRTKVVHQPVEIRYEEIIVERIGPNEQPPQGTMRGRIPEAAFEEGEMYIPRLEETPVITKTTELIDGVRIAREIDHEHREVTATLRREDIDIEREGTR